MAHTAFIAGDAVRWTGDTGHQDRVLVVNGDLGSVKAVDEDGYVATVQFEDGEATVSTEHLEWVEPGTTAAF
jgi:hypothetical protein